ncbi:MAG: NUDIX domain-containing protein [Halanaerobiales bacterium]
MGYPEPTVGAVIVGPDNRVLLCKSSKWDGKFVIPGGHIEPGEKMEETLKREVREETGLEIYDIQVIGVNESVFAAEFHEERHFIFIDYICRTDSKEVVLNEEAEEYVWVDLEVIDDYDLNSSTEALLLEVIKGKNSENRVEIFYDF